MLERGPEQHTAEDSLDQIALDLRQLRQQAGDVSYAEIVRRISKHRESRGTPQTTARPARTTVYDAFRTGRSRVNAQLIGEIAQALGVPEKEAIGWERRCLAVGRISVPPQELTPTTPTAHEPAAEPDNQSDRPWITRPVIFSTLLLLACLGINFAGYAGVEFLRLPLYLDAIGTGIAAIVLGPWWGVAVGVSTNLLGYTIHGSIALPFALQSAAFALVWGYGARHFRMTRTIGSYFKLTMWVGLSHMFVAIPINLVMFGGGSGHAGNAVFENLAALGVPLFLAVYMGLMMIALPDALVAAFVILVTIGFVKTKPPFQEQCADLFPFLTSPGSSHALARAVAMFTRPWAAVSRHNSPGTRIHAGSRRHLLTRSVKRLHESPGDACSISKAYT